MLADLEQSHRGKKACDRQKQLKQAEKNDRGKDNYDNRLPAAEFVAIRDQRACIVAAVRSPAIW